MSNPIPGMRWLQAGLYLLETAVLALMLSLAASGSPEFALGPAARLLVAAALPLPCHLLLVTSRVWAGRTDRRRSASPVPELRPRPLPA